jgi:hypothetical protein
MPTIDDLPGFRRRFVVSPIPSRVRAELEDDYHCMSVTLQHDGQAVTAVEPVMTRAPWNTCPGAVAELERTFTGAALASAAGRGLKTANCTHLYDLAVLAAAHAHECRALTYDILVADPVEGMRAAELRRDGSTLLTLTHVDGRIVEPPELKEVTLWAMRPWIESLDSDLREAARIFQWGTILAFGRTIPLEDQSDASRMPVGRCYSFQPHIVTDARRIGEIRDFSDGTAHPLDRSESMSAVG